MHIPITVFTPTYNRAYTLTRLYNSLIEQTFIFFEWIIVDDGSTDGTKEVVENFSKEGPFNIYYYCQQNKGKHSAINKGVALAKGKLFFIVDSDDKLLPIALERIWLIYNQNKDLKDIGGVVGRKAYFNGTLVGNKQDLELIYSNSIEIRFKHYLKGDLAEVFLTRVIKEFPFPEHAGEYYCPESVIWNRIAQKYNLLFFSEVVYLCEYLVDGLTSKIVKNKRASPLAAMTSALELTQYDIPFIWKLKAGINYWRFAFYAKIPFWKKLSYLNWRYSIIGLPGGLIMMLNDSKHINKANNM